MKLTPLMIYQREFRRKAINGLDPEDVETFLFQVAEGVEALLSENDELQRRLGRPPESAEDDAPASSGGEIRATRAASARELEQARGEAARVRDGADEEAQRIVAEARQQAEELMTLARRRAEARAQGSGADPETARALAREYQSLLVQHLSRVTTFIGDSEPASAGDDSADGQEADEQPTTQIGPTSQ